MSDTFDIQAYMTHGVERVVEDILKATFRNPRESAYMAKFALASRAASRKHSSPEIFLLLLSIVLPTEEPDVLFRRPEVDNVSPLPIRRH